MYLLNNLAVVNNFLLTKKLTKFDSAYYDFEKSLKIVY